MVFAIVSLPWYLGIPACLLSFGNASICTWKVLKASNGYLILMEHEDDEAGASQGAVFRKWFLLTMFCSSISRGISLAADSWLEARFAYSGSSLQYLCQVLPSCLYLVSQSYFAFYLSSLHNSISGTESFFPFPKAWIQSSIFFTLIVTLLLLVQERDILVHGLLAGVNFLILSALLFHAVGLMRTMSARIAMATRKVLLRMQLLVTISSLALIMLLVCRINASIMDYSNRCVPIQLPCCASDGQQVDGWRCPAALRCAGLHRGDLIALLPPAYSKLLFVDRNQAVVHASSEQQHGSGGGAQRGTIAQSNQRHQQDRQLSIHTS